jgi:hypothetical protein
VTVALLVMGAALEECGGGLVDFIAMVRIPVTATSVMVAAVAGLGALLPDGGHVVRLVAMVSVGAGVYTAATVVLWPGILGEIRHELPRCRTA